MDKPQSFPCFWIDKDSRGEWRWTFFAANREPIAVSSEGYVSKTDCLHGLTVMKNLISSPIYHSSAGS